MAHQAKRPYNGSQPQITSFFPSTSQLAQPQRTSTTQAYQQSQDVSSPALPASVQSNLLSVGMRIRKSVPEGYKTGTHSAFGLFSDTNTPMPTDAEKGAGMRRPGRARARELTPFCGILKVGGMAVQEPQHPQEQDRFGIYDSTAMDDDGLGDLGYVPFLSSQGSTISNESVGSFDERELGFAARKRRFNGEDEVDGEEVSKVVVVGLGERVLAVPRRRGEAKVGDMDGRIGVVRGLGQENTGCGDVDFEEADFLDYGLVEEVEMSDI